jgi:hypothetical protein
MIRWNGKNYSPRKSFAPVSQTIEELMKPLSEKKFKGNVWRAHMVVMDAQQDSSIPVTSTPTQTGTPAVTPSPTASMGQTPTPTPNVTSTPTSTPTNTPSQTQTGTPNPTTTPTNTPSQTQTSTPNQTSTPTNTPSQTQTGTPNPTTTPTNTGTPNPTTTPTQTGTPTPSPTPAPFSPSGLTNLQMWYISTSGVTNTGGFASAWTNYGSIGGSVVQSDATRRPEIITTGVRATLGSFTGQTLYFGDRDNMTQTFGATSFSAMTAFAVFKQNQTAGQYNLTFASTFNHYSFNNQFIAQHNPSNITLSVGNTTSLSSKPLLYISSGDTSAYDAEWLAGSVGTFTGTKTANSASTTVTQQIFGYDGGGFSTSGLISVFEYIVYNKKLTESEYNQVVNYLKTKYQYSTW